MRGIQPRLQCPAALPLLHLTQGLSPSFVHPILRPIRWSKPMDPEIPAPKRRPPHMDGTRVGLPGKDKVRVLLLLQTPDPTFDTFAVVS